MEGEHYPITNQVYERIEQLTRHEQSLYYTQRPQMRFQDATHVSVLLSLAVELLDDNDSLKQLNKQLWMPRDVARSRRSLFLHILKLWMSEKEKPQNFLYLIKTLRQIQMNIVADLLEPLLMEYVLQKEATENTFGYELLPELPTPSLPVPLYQKSWNPSDTSMAQAMTNSLVLKNVFEKLPVDDKKAFRLVSKTWYNDVLPEWRSTQWLLIHKHDRLPIQEGNEIPANNNINIGGQGINMSEYVGLIQREQQQQQEQEAAPDFLRLLQVPYKNYSIEYGKVNDNTNNNTTIITPAFHGQLEVAFWGIVGHTIYKLKISMALLDTPHFSSNVGTFEGRNIEWLLLNGCKNLRFLDISRNNTFENSSTTTSLTTTTAMNLPTGNADNAHVARKLQTLILCSINNANLSKRILAICPHLKTCSFMFDGDMEGLWNRTAINTFISLQKLVMVGNLVDYSHLRKYVVITASSSVNQNLRDIQIVQTSIGSIRNKDLDFHNALGRCKALNKLSLQVLIVLRENNNNTINWFIDLTPFSYSNLTVLKLRFNVRNQEQQQHQGQQQERDLFQQPIPFRFDFGALQNMPALCELIVEVSPSLINPKRVGGKWDWVYTGNNEKYLPKNIVSHYSTFRQINCQHLWKLRVRGWILSQYDVHLFGNFFPNVTHFDGHVSANAVQEMYKQWKKLENVRLKVDSFISLSQLRPFKERNLNFNCVQSNGSVTYKLCETNDGIFYFVML